MKKKIFIVLWIALMPFLLAGCASSSAQETEVPQETDIAASATPDPAADLPTVVGKLHWFGTSSILYHGSKNIYFDPVTLEGDLPKADFILISHAHSDHADLESIQKIIGPGTILIISPNVQGFYQAHPHEIGVVPLIMKEGDAEDVGGIRVEAVPAYDEAIHFRSTGGAGFVVTIDGERIYFAGGTRVFTEMADIVSDVTLYPWYRNADILAAAEILQTKVLIPVHAGESGVKAFVDVYAKEITRLKIIALVPGAYNP